LSRQKRAGTGDRRIGWHGGDPIGACVGRKTRHVKHDQSCESRAGESARFHEVIDTSRERLVDGVGRITGGYGADVVIDGIGGEVLSEALRTLAQGGSLTTLGYSAGRKTTIDVTDLIWKQASITSFILFAQPQAAWADAWKTIVALLQSGAIKPIVARLSRWPKRLTPPLLG